MAFVTVYLTQNINGQSTKRAKLQLIDRRGNDVESFYARPDSIPAVIHFSPDGKTKRRYIRDTSILDHNFFEAAQA